MTAVPSVPHSVLDGRLTELEATQAILDTLYRYAHSIDYGLEDDWVDCFTEDAVWYTKRNPIAAAGRPDHRYQGQAELRAFVSAHTRPPVGWHKHMLVEPRIHLDGDRCRVDSYMMRLDAHPAGSYVRAFGRYRDRLVRCPDGRWRIEERIAEIDGTHPFGEPGAGPDVSEAWSIEEIKRLKARYSRYFDEKRWPEWADLLTENVQAWLTNDSAPIEGRDPVVAYVSPRVADATTVHEVSMPDIRITGPTTADGTWDGLSLVDAPDGTTRRQWARHDDQYELGADGCWRIRAIRVTELRNEAS